MAEHTSRHEVMSLVFMKVPPFTLKVIRFSHRKDAQYAEGKQFFTLRSLRLFGDLVLIGEIIREGCDRCGHSSIKNILGKKIL